MSSFSISELDAIDWLRVTDPESIDLIVTDPPYESLEKWRKIGTTTRLSQSKGSSNRWFEVFPNERFEELFQQFHRVLKKNAHLYVFSDDETSEHLKKAGKAAGFKFWKPLVWDKIHMGMGYHYRATYEFILFFEKGKRKLNSLGIPDILRHKRIHKGFPAEKPQSLLEVLISQSSFEGDTVADPFCGSGTTGLAALKLGRDFIGNDLDPVLAEVTRVSLSQGFSDKLPRIRKLLRKRINELV
jgi:site-specific DNA-methyltransferase (adenine-specific)